MLCEWIEEAEKALGTHAGVELGMNEIVGTPSALPVAERKEAWQLHLDGRLQLPAPTLAARELSLRHGGSTTSHGRASNQPRRASAGSAASFGTPTSYHPHRARQSTYMDLTASKRAQLDELRNGMRTYG